MKYRSLFVAGALASAALAVAVMTPAFGVAPAAAATAPPTPPPLSSVPVASPTPVSSTAPYAVPTLTPIGSPNPSATKTPAPRAGIRKGIEGVWEVQIQRGPATEYDHFQLKQNENALTGFYLDTNKTKFPLAGSLDGKTVRIVVTFADGTTAIFSAELDGTTDMLGLMTTPKESTPFTAAYRPKESFFDNINPAPGGMGGPGITH